MKRKQQGSKLKCFSRDQNSNILGGIKTKVFLAEIEIEVWETLKEEEKLGFMSIIPHSVARDFLNSMTLYQFAKVKSRCSQKSPIRGELAQLLMLNNGCGLSGLAPHPCMPENIFFSQIYTCQV